MGWHFVTVYVGCVFVCVLREPLIWCVMLVVECSACSCVRNWELSNWSSYFTLLLHLSQLIIGSVFRRIATDWISYFGKCIFGFLTLASVFLDFLLWQVYFWISYFGKCIFGFLTLASVFLDFLLWQVYFWISYFGKCIFNTRLNSDVLRKDILAGMFILSGFYGYITCVTSEINACRADPGGLEV